MWKIKEPVRPKEYRKMFTVFYKDLKGKWHLFLSKTEKHGGKKKHCTSFSYSWIENRGAWTPLSPWAHLLFSIHAELRGTRKSGRRLSGRRLQKSFENWNCTTCEIFRNKVDWKNPHHQWHVRYRWASINLNSVVPQTQTCKNGQVRRVTKLGWRSSWTSMAGGQTCMEVRIVFQNNVHNVDTDSLTTWTLCWKKNCDHF